MTKLFFKPKVYMVSYPMLNYESVREILSEEFPEDQNTWAGEDASDASTDASTGEKICEFAGRMCYGSFGKKQGRKSTLEYISNIIDMGHGSVLEHANYGFLVCRASRGFTHQMVRHRAGFSYSQESTHFIKYGPEQANFCLPGMEGLTRKSLETLQNTLNRAMETYIWVVDEIDRQLPEETERRGKAMTGTARNVLPIAIESKLMFTANIRALRHFVELRGAHDNTMEIREVACQVVELMKERCPVAFDEYYVMNAEDGFRMVGGVCNRKV